MDTPRQNSLSAPSPLVLGFLVLSAVLGFIIVGQLVGLYQRHRRELAGDLYQLGLSEQNAGRPGRAIEDFRTALTYEPDNAALQLSLGRALRDTGQLDEAESYLLSLWERTPQDSTINLALARLAARRGNVIEALRYYHNAMYGEWKFDADANRRTARFELIDFLLQKNAYPEAQSELIALVPALPPDPNLHLRVAEMFARAQDLVHALNQYQTVLQEDHKNVAALLGAGQAAFQQGHYRTAEAYLQAAVNASSPDPRAETLLQRARLILQADPFRRGISDAERNRRIRVAFEQAGGRLEKCLLAPANLGGTASAGLWSLKSQWQAMKPKLKMMSRHAESDLPDAIMDLVFQIEQQTQKECGTPEGLDQALLLISRDRSGVDR